MPDLFEAPGDTMPDMSQTDRPSLSTPVQVPMEDPDANGLHADIPAEEYYEIDRCSNSRLSLLEQSPAHAKEAIDNPKPSTKSQRIGTATRTAILEPELMDEAVAVIGQCEGTTNSGKQCSYNGKVRRDGHSYCKTHDPGEEEAGEAYDGLVVSEDDYEDIARMRDAVHEHPAASKLLSGGSPEVTALFSHEDVDRETGEVCGEIGCKARIDYYHPACTLVDLKTTRDASRDAFQKTLWNYSYYRQLAFYRYALEQCGKGVGECVIVAAEKQPPYGVAVYELSETTLKAGMRQLEDLLATYAECVRTGEWPCYPEEVQGLELPHWVWDKL